MYSEDREESVFSFMRNKCNILLVVRKACGSKQSREMMKEGARSEMNRYFFEECKTKVMKGGRKTGTKDQEGKYVKGRKAVRNFERMREECSKIINK